MSRWVRIAVSIFDDEAFEPAPFSEREAWIWMIVNAAWKDTTHRVGNAVLPVPMGTFFTTLRSLCSAWNWKSDTRVRSFLRVLENQRMISMNSNAGKTQIEIRNYKKYQSVGFEANAEETQEQRTENASGTHEKRTKDTNTPIHQVKDTSIEVSKKRGSRLSSDWSPSSQEIDFAIAEGHDLQSARREADKFRDYWTAKAGAGATKLDWTATWKNWVRNSKTPIRGPGAPPGKPKLTAFQQKNVEDFAYLKSLIGVKDDTGTDDYRESIDLGAEDFRSSRAASSGF